MQLDEFLEKIGGLPIDCNRNLRLMRELDIEFELKQQQLNKLQVQYLQKKQSKNAKQLGEEIERLQKECLGLSSEKIQMAVQLYEQIDETLQQLDGDLKKFESELKKINTEINSDYKDELKSEVSLSKKSKNIRKDMKFSSNYKLKHQQQNKLIQNIENSNEQFNQIEMENENETKYCFCNKVYLGSMVACDNPFCEKEWFHFECVGITQQPKGKWYCKDCQNLKKKDLLKF